MQKARVLVVDDEQMIRWSMAQTLGAAGHHVTQAETASEGMSRFRESAPELVFLDVRLPDGNGMDLLAQMKEENGPDCDVIVMTAFGEIRTAVEAMRLGAFDYLRKPFEFEELDVIVGKALEARQLRRELTELRRERQKAYGIDNIVGNSPRIRQVLQLVEKVAASDATTVLLQGENGTGKDLVARAIHGRSRRAEAAFLDISCTAVPETLIESELFGFEKGAFTDARSPKRGLVELADGGTLFLDEIGDMPLGSQAKLLKFIETRQFKRLGGTVDQRVDLRIIAATNRDLAVAVRDGNFRQDLYYRLKVIPIGLPPLREWCEDVPLLLQYYMDKCNAQFHKSFKHVADDALRVLMTYSWPGNVRELRNLMERILILEHGDTIQLEHLPQEIVEAPPAAVTGDAALPAGSYRLPPTGASLEAIEKDLLRQAMELAGGNQTRAAQLLSISRDSLRYRLQRLASSK